MRDDETLDEVPESLEGLAMDTFRFKAYTADTPEARGFVFDIDVNETDLTIYASVVDDRAGKMQRWLERMKSSPQTLVIDFTDDYARLVCRKLYHGATVIGVNQRLRWKDNAPVHFQAIIEYESCERQENPKRETNA